jgi:hypothetical protein
MLEDGFFEQGQGGQGGLELTWCSSWFESIRTIKDSQECFIIHYKTKKEKKIEKKGSCFSRSDIRPFIKLLTYHHEVLKQRSLKLQLELGSVLTHVKDLPMFLEEQLLFLVYRIARMLLYILCKTDRLNTSEIQVFKTDLKGLE